MRLPSASFQLWVARRAQVAQVPAKSVLRSLTATSSCALSSAASSVAAVPKGRHASSAKALRGLVPAMRLPAGTVAWLPGLAALQGTAVQVTKASS